MKTLTPHDPDFTNLSGAGKVIYGDKCEENWTEVECPNPATCAEFHFGQFGHKVMFFFCEECYAKPRPFAEFGIFQETDRYFEKYEFPISVVIK